MIDALFLGNGILLGRPFPFMRHGFVGSLVLSAFVAGSSLRYQLSLPWDETDPQHVVPLTWFCFELLVANGIGVFLTVNGTC